MQTKAFATILGASFLAVNIAAAGASDAAGANAEAAATAMDNAKPASFDAAFLARTGKNFQPAILDGHKLGAQNDVFKKLAPHSIGSSYGMKTPKFFLNANPDIRDRVADDLGDFTAILPQGENGAEAVVLQLEKKTKPDGASMHLLKNIFNAEEIYLLPTAQKDPSKVPVYTLVGKMRKASNQQSWDFSERVTRWALTAIEAANRNSNPEEEAPIHLERDLENAVDMMVLSPASAEISQTLDRCDFSALPTPLIAGNIAFYAGKDGETWMLADASPARDNRAAFNVIGHTAIPLSRAVSGQGPLVSTFTFQEEQKTLEPYNTANGDWVISLETMRLYANLFQPVIDQMAERIHVHERISQQAQNQR